jgi:chromosome transmission fidelity protein 1
MQPMNDFIDLLFSSQKLPSQKLRTFSCGHIIPPENLVCISLSKGCSGVDFNFTFQNRESTQLIDGLGVYLFIYYFMYLFIYYLFIQLVYLFMHILPN